MTSTGSLSAATATERHSGLKYSNRSTHTLYVLSACSFVSASGATSAYMLCQNSCILASSLFQPVADTDIITANYSLVSDLLDIVFLSANSLLHSDS